MPHELWTACTRGANLTHSFWLLSDGRLVFVNDNHEDFKLRNNRTLNVQAARELWRIGPAACDQTLRTARHAYDNLIRVCEEAVQSSNGCFYNLYAQCLLAVQMCEAQTLDSRAMCTTPKSDVRCHEISTGHTLTSALNLKYRRYFDYVLNDAGSSELKKTRQRPRRRVVDRTRSS